LRNFGETKTPETGCEVTQGELIEEKAAILLAAARSEQNAMG
jgi:hypothetical protein